MSVSSVSISIALVYIYFFLFYNFVNLNTFATRIVSPTDSKKMKKSLCYRKRRYWLGHYFYFFSTDKNFTDTLEEMRRQAETGGEYDGEFLDNLEKGR